MLVALISVSLILGQAREYMKEDLHNTRTLKTTSPVDSGFNQIPELEGLHLAEGIVIQEQLFRLPRGQVSEHVFKIMELVRSTLEETKDSNVSLAGKLIHAATYGKKPVSINALVLKIGMNIFSSISA